MSLCLDFTQRLTISGALSHPYLTNGSIYVPSSDEIADSPSMKESSDDMGATIVDPTKFHFGEPLVLPKGQAQSSQEDQQWSRRQFSVLWAPMPADYSFDGQVSNIINLKHSNKLQSPLGFFQEG